MTYRKPEIAVLGDAVRVIQGIKSVAGGDVNRKQPQPAYELDEEQ